MSPESTTCSCVSCEGASCTCGCQVDATPKGGTCSCGDACTCGSTCACGPTCRCGAGNATACTTGAR